MALPSGYTRVEYIQTSGGQYIDTGYTPNNNTRVAVKFMWDGGTSGYLFGAVDSNNAKAFTSTMSTTGGNWRFDGTTYKLTATANTLYTANMDSSGVTINGILNKYAGTVSSFTALNTLAVCGGKNSNGTMSTSYFVGKIYYFKIYDNGTLVRDFVPCKNASGVVGLYDEINKVFYSKNGTGTFVAGPEITVEYKVVDASELNGALTATANAIRTKRETTDVIPWNSTTGFASAIESISSGIKAAIGTFTVAQSSSIYSNPVTVTGLKFKPTRVMFFNNNAGDNYGIINADTATKRYTTYYYDEYEYEDEETGESYSETYYYVNSFDFIPQYYTTGLVVTFNADGFTISATTQYGPSGYDGLNWPWSSEFTYIAIGE